MRVEGRVSLTPVVKILETYPMAKLCGIDVVTGTKSKKSLYRSVLLSSQTIILIGRHHILMKLKALSSQPTAICVNKTGLFIEIA